MKGPTRNQYLWNCNPHNSKTTCDRRKPIVNLESTSKNASIKEKDKQIKNTRNYRTFTQLVYID